MKGAFYIKVAIIVGVLGFQLISVADSYAATGNEQYYSYPIMVNSMNECTDNSIRIGAPEDGKHLSRTVFEFTDDFVLKCDIVAYGNFDFNLAGHTISAIDGHKIIVNEELRIYGGNVDDVTIETDGDADLVFGSGNYDNLKVYAGARFETVNGLNDVNDVYLQGGYYNDSTFFISQGGNLDIDGASFTSSSANRDESSVVLRLDDRLSTGIESDARLNIEAAYFKSTNSGCNGASIKLEASSTANMAAHVNATIEYAVFEGQNAILTDIGTNRTGDKLEILDGESELDGNFIIAKGNSNDPELMISDGEYMTKSSFYANPNTCSDAVELRAEPVDSGIYSNADGVVLRDGYTLVPIKDRDYDGDGNDDVSVKRMIDASTVNLTLNAGEAFELELKNLDGEIVLPDDIEWLNNGDIASAEGLKIIAKSPGEAEIILKYGTQEKKYRIVVKGNSNASTDDSKEDNSEEGDGDSEMTTPLTIDSIMKSKYMFVMAGMAVGLLVLVFKKHFSRGRI